MLPACLLTAGFSPATPRHPNIPIGRDAVPHVIFLLTLWPLMWVSALVGIVVHAPLCAVYFAISGQ
jgi:hypothetical protein